jgi:hypothetical protein
MEPVRRKQRKSYRARPELHQNVGLFHEQLSARTPQLGARGQPVIALVDGEHHPDTARDALDGLAQTRKVAAVVFCGGYEKVGGDVLRSAERHYGRPVVTAPTPEQALRSVAAKTRAAGVVDLADEPVLAPPERMRLAALGFRGVIARVRLPGEPCYARRGR